MEMKSFDGLGSLEEGDLEDGGEELGMSQQSASLYLMDLEKQQFIERSQKRSGSRIRITREGVDILMTLYREMRPLIVPGRKIEVKGTISAGLGEGAYYLSQDGYIDQLKELFDMDPFPGTLNIQLSENDSPKMARLPLFLEISVLTS